MNDTPNDSHRRKVRCPKCGKLTLFSPENSFRPFCSERCQMTDLGTWASESYRIPDDKKISEFDFSDSEQEKN